MDHIVATASVHPNRWMTTGEVFAEYGFDASLVRYYRLHGHPMLRRPLKHKPWPRGRGFFYWRADLALIASKNSQPSDGDEKWKPDHLVKSRFGFAQATLFRWKKHCPHLGRPLRSIRVVSPRGHFKTLYSVEDLELIQNAKAGEIDWLIKADANRLGFSDWKLKQLSGAVRSKIRAGSGGSRGWIPRQRVYWRPDLESQKTKPLQPAASDYIPLRQARAQFGSRCPSVATLVRWANRCRYLGRPLKHKWSDGERSSGVPCPRMLYVSRSDLERALDIRDRSQEVSSNLPHEDADGRWLPASYIAEHFPTIKLGTLWGYRTYPCAALARKVRAKQIPRIVAANKGGLWVYHEDDVRIIAGKPAEPPPPPTAQAGGADTPGQAVGAAERPAETRKRGGRPLSVWTAQVYAYCYQRHQNSSDPLRKIMNNANGRWPGSVGAPGNVPKYARRHATRNNLPFKPRESAL